MVTIRDIARKTNVAPGTVSMVLNGRGRLSPETRRRIEAAIGEMGYRPKPAGRPKRAMMRAPTNIAIIYAQRVAIGGVLSQLSQAWIGGIRDVAIESSWHLNLIGGIKDGSRDEMFRHSLDQQQIDGVILIGITADDGQAYLAQSVERHLPCVVMNRTPMHGEFSYVAMDNFGSGKHVADFLLAQGHKRVAMIHLRVPDRYASDRQAGAEAGLAANDMNLVRTELVDHDASDEQLARACRAVVDHGATAVYVTAGDVPAARCIDIWNKMGVKVPRDLSVIGWDDIGPRSRSGLLPTSVGYDKHQMGREAALMIIDLMRNRGVVSSKGLIVPTRVVEHDTSAPAKKEATD
jgi:LacI family transcriptional regulator